MTLVVAETQFELDHSLVRYVPELVDIGLLS